MRIAICDDEKQFVNEFTASISKLYKSLDMIIDEFTSGQEFLHSFQTKPYDIVFLDIEMPEMDGLSVARKLRQLSEDVYIIFLTSHTEFAMEGYEVSALRYLKKPADEEKIRQIIDYVLQKQLDNSFRILRNSEGDHRIKLTDIIFLEAQDKNVIFYTASGSIEVRGRLNDWEKDLQSKGFFRVHRRYIVSLSKVIHKAGSILDVAGGYKIEVARSKERAFMDAWMSFVNKEAF